jgi:replicative DNA helicase
LTVAPTSNGRNPPDPDRNWMLRALRGEITTEGAYITVRNARWLWRNGQLGRDQEAVTALNIGDNAHLDDPKRFEPLEETWLQADVDYDPATEAAFDKLTQRDDFGDGYQPWDESESSYDPDWVSLIVDGKTWLTSGPDHPNSLWGDTTTILAAKGQPTTIAGPQGAGKSVFGQRLALGWLGIIPDILGIPVQPGDRNILYLASDRPEQARLSMRRMIADDQLDVLEARMRVWKGPPPEDVAKQPLMLLHMAQAADAGFIIIDSAKDVALKLSADEVGAAYNSALQHCVANLIEIVALHHPRKLSGETKDNPVRVLDDLYGAYWITAGNGSVVYLQPGDFDTYTLTQLKSPNGTKAEIPYEHVTATGDIQPPSGLDLIGIIEEAGYDGCSGAHITRCLYKISDPNDRQKKAVSRRLRELAEEGVVQKVGETRNTRWRLTE